jgi:hypothetical protein
MTEEDRMAYTVLRNAGYLPPEVELLKEIDALRGRLAEAQSDAERRYLIKQIDEKSLAFNLMQEQKQVARHRARKAR